MSDPSNPSLPGTDPTSNARFKQVSPGMYSEMMADQVQLFYDPTTQAARVMFNCLPYLLLDEGYHALNVPYDILDVDFSNKMMECYGAGLKDPVTGVDLGLFSVAGMMLKIKAAMDVEYNARAQQRAAMRAQAEAMAAAVNLAATALDGAAPNGTQADFRYTVDGLKVTFEEMTILPPDVEITSRVWIFSDGNAISNAPSPVYTFTRPGAYAVTLVNIDSAGNKVKCTQQVQVNAATSLMTPAV